MYNHLTKTASLAPKVSLATLIPHLIIPISFSFLPLFSSIPSSKNPIKPLTKLVLPAILTNTNSNASLSFLEVTVLRIKAGEVD